MTSEIISLISARYPNLANTRFVIRKLPIDLRDKLVKAGIPMERDGDPYLISPGVMPRNEFYLGSQAWADDDNICVFENQRVIKELFKPVNVLTNLGPEQLYSYPFVPGYYHVVSDKLVKYEGRLIVGLKEFMQQNNPAGSAFFDLAVFEGLFCQWKWYPCDHITIVYSVSPEAINVVIGKENLVVSISDLTSVLI